MPAPTLLARGIAFALLGAAAVVEAAPQQEPAQDAAQLQPAPSQPDLIPDATQAQPLQAAPQPGAEQDDADQIEPIAPATNEVPPANVPLLNYTLELGVEHDSNINLSADNPVGQTLLMPRATFAYDQAGSTLQAHVVGQVEYIDYLGGAFDNEFRGQLAGSLNWNILPQRLSFSVLDSSSVQPIDILASNAPNNLQQINILSAGPVLSFRFGGGALHGQAEAHYIDTTASVSKGFDSQRELGALRLIDDLNATDQLSGNIEAEHVHLQNPLLVPASMSDGYDRYDAYGHYLSKLAHATIDTTLGWSRFSFGSGFPDQSGVLARARIDWRIGGHSSLGVGAARQLTDAAEELLLNPDRINPIVGIGDLGIGNDVITPDVYRENRIDADYAWQGPRLRIDVTPYYRRLHYIGDATLDRSDRGVALDLGYRLTPLMTLGFGAGAQHTRYTTLDRRDSTYGFGPTLTDQLTPHWSWRLELTHSHRSSSAIGRGFNDNVALFVVSFKR